jgi:hypothetical protein
MGFEAAARFLATALPWPAAGAEPPEFFVNIHTRDAKNPKFGLYGRACRTLDEALRQIEYLVSKDQDVWVCMSSQRTGKQKTNKAGWTYYGAVRNIANALSHRSIYIDIDVKERGFEDLAAATTAFNEFTAKAGLPAPTLAVVSGSGLHVHWCFVDAIDTPRWMALSDRLVAAMQQHGFAPIDYGVTRDPVRLLRVPDTFNYKTDPAKPVYLLHEGQTYDVTYLEDALKGYQVTRSVNSIGASAAHNAGIAWPENMPPPPKGVAFKPLAEGAGKILPTLDQVAQTCPSIKNSLEAGGVADPQPLWHAMAKVACFTMGGVDDFLDMSDGHPQFEEASATAFYERVSADQKRGNLGWPSCQTIRDAGGVACAGCPHVADGKSPFHFIEAEEVVGQAPPGPANDDNLVGYEPNRTIDQEFRTDPPFGFYFKLNKLYQQIAKANNDNDGDSTDSKPSDIVICPYYIERMWYQTEPYRLNLMMQTDQRGLRQITLRAEDMASLERYSTTLYKQGVTISRGLIPRLHLFMTSWIEQMREKRIATVQSERFGWAVTNGKTHSFVYGKTRYNREGSSPINAQDGLLGTMYTPTGALEPWLRASRLVCDQRRPSLNAILASAFAAPLVNFTGENGFMISAFSPESGMQKSTAMRVAQAVWGDPVKAMNSLNDTANSVNKKLGALRHLPMYYDEIKMEEGNRRNLDTLFELSQGKTKTRLDRASDLQDIETWSTLMQTASNSSMVGFIGAQSKTTTAGVHRVFEYQVTRGGNQGMVSLGDAGKVLADLNNNFGKAGELYAAWLGKNIDMIGDRVSSAKDKITKQVNGKPEERFWITAIAVLMLGAKFGNENKLVSIDENALLSFLLSSFNTLRRQVDGSHVNLSDTRTVFERLAQYFNQRKRMTIVTDFLPGSGRPKDCMVINVNEAMHAPAFFVRVAQQDRVIRISKSDFTKWCIQENIAPSLLINAMMKQLGAIEIRGSVTSGVGAYRAAAESLIELSDINSQLAQFYDFT